MKNEYVTDGDWNAVRRNFEKDQIDTGGILLAVRSGSGTVTWPGGSPVSSAVTITHGLGRVPVSITLTPIASTVPAVLFVSAAATSTSFDVKGRTSDGSSPAAASTQSFYWKAEG